MTASDCTFERLLEKRPDMAQQMKLLHISVSANRNMTALAGKLSGVAAVSLSRA